jgi:hypothetical protein
MVMVRRRKWVEAPTAQSDREEWKSGLATTQTMAATAGQRWAETQSALELSDIQHRMQQNYDQVKC